MDNVKKLKRGEILFKEGDAITTVYLIQSGKVGLFSERGGKRLEVFFVGGSQVLGETGLSGPGRHAFTAEAQQETKYLEVPLDLLKPIYEKTPTALKLILKSTCEDLKKARQQMRMSKAEGENVPCPEGLVHRIFTEMHLISRHIGKADPKNPNDVRVSWSALKLYATRFFGESPQRLRSFADLLLKLQLAELSFADNEEGEKELAEIHLLNTALLEEFAEFFQYHLFKGAKAEAIYVDPLALKVAKAFVELSVGAEVDHKGASRVDFTNFVNEVKAKFRFELKNTHLDTLEKKGLFVKRQSLADSKVVLSFDRPEFVKMAQYWSILHEIEKWNTLGQVNLNEKPEAELASGEACGQCQGPIDDKHKFCPNCGAKLANAA